MKELNDRAEISGAMNWAEVVQSGGFPRVLATDPEHRRRLMEDYIQVFASRDIREVLEIESPDKFEQFIRLLAARTAQIQNHSTIANELGVAVSTVRRWVDALDRSYLINHIPAYSRNAGHRIIKSSKLVITDSALALAASRSSVPTGFHFETFIASDIAVWKDLSYGRGLYHWRSGSKEVDFILEEGNRLLAVEIKTSSTINYSDSKHLRAFMSAYPEAKRGILLSSDPTIRDLTSDIIAAPWWAVV
ncbi:MAG: DUF4143 domain-containing protein [bacterium]|nr:DUF4143 domain-containing protein [bacterium]